jgi:hypothetical protein
VWDVRKYSSIASIRSLFTRCVRDDGTVTPASVIVFPFGITSPAFCWRREHDLRHIRDERTQGHDSLLTCRLRVCRSAKDWARTSRRAGVKTETQRERLFKCGRLLPTLRTTPTMLSSELVGQPSHSSCSDADSNPSAMIMSVAASWAEGMPNAILVIGVARQAIESATSCRKRAYGPSGMSVGLTRRIPSDPEFGTTHSV